MRYGGGQHGTGLGLPKRLLALLLMVGVGASVVAAAGVLIPARKPGQWELRMTTGNAPEAVLQLCVDEATDKEMMDASLSIATSLCPLPIWSRDGDTIIILADCQIATGRTVMARAELAGDFQSSYSFSMHTQTGLGDTSTVDLEHRYQWVGKTCSDNLQPGFVKLPNGGKMKLKQMMKLLENINGN